MRSVLPLLLLSACASNPQQPAADPPPNVVVIITDDQGWGDFSFREGSYVDTPCLDRLAGQSAIVDPFYVHPVCAPTRASLMTGRYCQRTRAFDTYIGRAMMEPEEVTIAEVLGDAGYATGLFGKWHLGDCYPMRPQDQGFERVLMHKGGGIGQPSDPEGGERKYTDATLFDESGARVETTGYCTQVYVDAAIDFAGQAVEEGKPFFTYIATNAPHGPFHDVPPDLYEKYKGRDVSDQDLNDKQKDQLARIFAMIEDVDRGVGRMMDALDELGVAENTIVVFTLDNGPNTRRHHHGMRGMKASIYENGIRSPLIVRWPERVEAGHHVDRIAAHVDLLPTFAAAAGADVSHLKLDGRSILPLVCQEDVTWPDRHLVIQAHRGDEPIPYHNAMVRNQRWKLVNPSGFGKELESVVPKWELYDMSVDDFEDDDLAGEHPEVVAEMARVYDNWFEDIAATREDPFSPPPIYVGSEVSPEVHLTRQDWRRITAGHGWGSHANGSWSVDVRSAGPYSARVRFPGNFKVQQVELRIGEVSLKATPEEGVKDVTFEGVRLPHGRATVECSLKGTGKEGEARTAGAHQVILTHH